jgi:hypothetical protein
MASSQLNGSYLSQQASGVGADDFFTFGLMPDQTR